MTIAALRARSRILMWLVTVPLVLLALLAAMQIYAVIMVHPSMAKVLVMYAPMYVYIVAIWMVRQALKSIARGELFDRVVPRLLGRVGLALFVAALFNVFGVPLTTGLLFGRPNFFMFDGSAVTLGIVGATLVLVSQLLAQAAAMRAELDEII